MADDLTRPYIGYRSAGRRPERQQDRRASADAPLAALRGMISGVAGAPGDIESLVRMLPGLSEQTVLPTSEDIERRLPLRGVSETPVGRAFTTAGQLGGGFYTGPGSPLRAIAAMPSAVSRAGRDFVMAAGQPAVNVVKPKGGNWLAGSVEKAIEPMRRSPIDWQSDERVQRLQRQFVAEYGADPSNAELLEYSLQKGLPVSRSAPTDAMNRWLENKLAKYIRNEMATPEDPLRLLADRGVTHIPEGVQSLERVTEWIPETLEGRRATAGFPRGGMSQTPYGQGWEQLADEAIHNLPARARISPDTGGGSTKALQVEQENPWLLKVPPETMTYGAYPVEVRQELGFEHLVDELRNAINPASGLPENLRWKYQDLEKVTVPQAVQRVADINAWRAAQKAEADLMRAQNAATHLVKEYPEQGFKWVELKATPKERVTEFPSDWSIKYDDNFGHPYYYAVGPDGGAFPGSGAIGKTEEEARQHALNYINKQQQVDKSLEDALKYEGEVMGHCVGGYCPDVVEGRSRIYSLRDKKGQPHVTIEVRPGEMRDPIAWYESLPESTKAEMAEQGFGPGNLWNSPQLKAAEAALPGDIVQIKGKANRAPNPEYLPAVQDFVRSQNWSNVGDLKNTGLVDLQQMGVPAEMRGGQRFVTEDEYKDIVRKNAEGFAEGGEVHGYQAGGAVKVAKKTMRTLGDMVDEYVRKVRKIEELPEPSYNVTLERPTSAEVPGWHITTDLPGILETGAMTNKNVGGRNLQGYAPEHVGGAYFYADPRLARMKRDELLDMVEMDPLYAAELPILRAQLRRANQMVPDEDVGLNIPWQQSYSEGSFATRRPVLLNQIDRIYSSDPGVTKDMIRDTIIRRRRPGYADGGLVEADQSGANFPTDDFDPARIDSIVGELHAMNAG